MYDEIKNIRRNNEYTTKYRALFKRAVLANSVLSANECTVALIPNIRLPAEYTNMLLTNIRRKTGRPLQMLTNIRRSAAYEYTTKYRASFKGAILANSVLSGTSFQDADRTNIRLC